jgi:hypothetical protein
MRRAPPATLAAAAAALALVASAAGERAPVPLSGVALDGGTRIRLATAAKAPSILDVDSGRSTAIPGIPYARQAFVRVVGIGGRSAVLIARDRLYAVRATGPASRLGPGSEAAPAPDGASVWVKRRTRPSHCTLRHVRLDGRVLRGPKAIRCSWRAGAGGALGLTVSSTRIIDPATGRTVYKAHAPIVAVAGRRVVLADRTGVALSVVDTADGTQRRLDWPATSGSLFRWSVSGRFVALGFGNPSWTSEGRYPDDQYFDVWVVDMETARLTRLPGMPAFVALKFTNIAWTRDGRLVLLARSGGKYVLALWKPGQEHLQVKAVRLPALAAGSIPTFASVG